MREQWTGERLDDFRSEVNRRFNRVDGKLRALNARFDVLNRTLLQIAGGTVATLIAGFAGAIATQL